MAYVEVRNLERFYGKFHALKGVSFDVEQGELAALLGPSGCGKTTILRIIAGLEGADSGNISIDGRVVNDVPGSERGIGFVFQNYALFRYMTVYDNIAFGLDVEGVSREQIDARVRELVELIGLSGMEKRYPNELSGGQRQRVAFARALAPNPQVLLLDEPFAAIDAKIRKEMRSWLRQIVSRLGITSIFVTHDQEEALEVSDKIIVMSNGRIEQIGGPTEIYELPESAFVAKFAGNAPTLEDYDLFNGFKKLYEDSVAVVRPEYVEAFRQDNPEYAELVDIAQEGVVESVSFRGFYFELAINVGGTTVYTHRGMGRRRPIRPGDRMLVVVDRMYVMHGDDVEVVENKLLEDKGLRID